MDTNLYPALLPLYRPSVNPSDSFYTVTLLNPLGRTVSTIYTGNDGNPKTQILSFEKQPFISVSPYYWNNGKDWDHTARSRFGETLYPAGTYTFTINQDLNSMQGSYNTSMNFTGTMMKSASVTFTRDTAPVVTQQDTQPVITTVMPGTPSSTQTEGVTVIPISSPVPVKTTYTPLPAWIGLAGIIIAGLIVLGKNQ